eukprot:Opistho-2@27323
MRNSQSARRSAVSASSARLRSADSARSGRGRNARRLSVRSAKRKSERNASALSVRRRSRSTLNRRPVLTSRSACAACAKLRLKSGNARSGRRGKLSANPSVASLSRMRATGVAHPVPALTGSARRLPFAGMDHPHVTAMRPVAPPTERSHRRGASPCRTSVQSPGTGVAPARANRVPRHLCVARRAMACGAHVPNARSNPSKSASLSVPAPRSVNGGRRRRPVRVRSAAPSPGGEDGTMRHVRNVALSLPESGGRLRLPAKRVTGVVHVRVPVLVLVLLSRGVHRPGKSVAPARSVLLPGKSVAPARSVLLLGKSVAPARSVLLLGKSDDQRVAGVMPRGTAPATALLVAARGALPGKNARSVRPGGTDPPRALCLLRVATTGGPARPRVRVNVAASVPTASPPGGRMDRQHHVTASSVRSGPLCSRRRLSGHRWATTSGRQSRGQDASRRRSNCLSLIARFRLLGIAL